jgi:hypothetical protein
MLLLLLYTTRAISGHDLCYFLCQNATCELHIGTTMCMWKVILNRKLFIQSQIN